MQYGCLKEYKS